MIADAPQPDTPPGEPPVEVNAPQSGAPTRGPGTRTTATYEVMRHWRRLALVLLLIAGAAHIAGMVIDIVFPPSAGLDLEVPLYKKHQETMDAERLRGGLLSGAVGLAFLVLAWTCAKASRRLPWMIALVFALLAGIAGALCQFLPDVRLNPGFGEEVDAMRIAYLGFQMWAPSLVAALGCVLALRARVWAPHPEALAPSFS